MKKKAKSQVRQIQLLLNTSTLFLVALSVACTATDSQSLYEKGEEASLKNSAQAVEYYFQAAQREPKSKIALEAAKKAAPIALVELKDYQKALSLYRHIVLYSKNVNERNDAQKNIVDILFDKVGDYEKALLETNKLLDLVPMEDASQYQLKRAKAYNYLKKYYQVLIEIEPVLKSAKDQATLFEALLLKADANFSLKNLSVAVDIYQQLLREFNELAKKEQVGLHLAVCYEEMKDFKNAIEMLKKVKDGYPNPEFIEKKIEHLSERLKQLPGARGFRK